MDDIAPVMPEVDFGVGPLDDLGEILSQLRASGDAAVPVRYIGKVAWLFLRYTDVATALGDDERIPSAPFYEQYAEPSLGRNMQMMRGQEHRLNRALMASAFQPGVIRRLVESLLVPVANELIDGFADRRSIDLVSDYTNPYPFRIISRMLGIAVTDEQRVMDLVYSILRFPWEPERALQARADLDAFLQPIIAEHRAAPGDDILSRLVTAELEGHRLSDSEILDFLRLLYPAGAETTFLTMGSMMLEILSDRQLYERLLENPGDRPAAVEEALRKHPATALVTRLLEEPTMIGDVQLPAGSLILLPPVAANSDPSVFADPQDFSLDRGRKQHLTFGKGVHFCLGSHLAREELKVSLSLLLERLPGLRLAEDEEAVVTGVPLRGVHRLIVTFDEVVPQSRSA